MRLVTFTRRGYPSIGKLVGREAVDVCSVPGLPRTMRQLLKGRQVLLARVCELQAGDASTFALTDVGLEAPVEPGKYLAIGLNYRDHVAEANQIGFNVPDGVVAWIVVWAKDPFARQSQEAPACGVGMSVANDISVLKLSDPLTMMQSFRNDQIDAAMWTIGSLGGVLADKSGIRFISIPRRDIAGLENLPTVSAFVQTPWYNAHKPQAVKIQAAISDAVAQLKSDPVGSSKAVKAKYGAATAQDQWDSRTSEHASGSGEFGGLRRSIRPIPKAISPLNMEFFAPEV